MSAPAARVELFWPAGLSAEVALGAVEEFQGAGIEADCRVQPARRGVDTAAVVLLSGSMVEPFLQALFERLGADAHAALRRWVQRIFGHGDAAATPSTVVFENKATGTEFVFTPGLPEEAFRQAMALDPGPEPGRWVWVDGQGTWSRFEAGRRPRVGEAVS